MGIAVIRSSRFGTIALIVAMNFHGIQRRNPMPRDGSIVGSSWRGGDPQLDGRPQAKQRQESVSLRELHLIQRLRQLGPGSHAVFVIKTTTGRDGLHSFRFVENYGDDEAMK